MFYLLFKSRFFFQKLSKFVDPLSFDVVFRFDLHHIQMDATLFLTIIGVDIIFRSDLHHIQVDATHILVTMWC